MKALITGASSGLGEQFAYLLSTMGYDLILVARRKTHLQNIKKRINTNCTIIPLDLSDQDNIDDLYNIVENEDIDIVINNAGFGLLGEFTNISIDDEYRVIKANIKAVHYLTKKFLKKFIKQDKGRILNVSSSAAFTSGPLFSTYYATKGYVLQLSEAIYEELKRKKSNVHISVLCPGPIDTEFNNIAHGKFKKALNPEYVAKYAIKKTLKNKVLIIPGLTNKLCVFATRLLPRKLVLKINYNVQQKKIDLYNKK